MHRDRRRPAHRSGDLAPDREKRGSFLLQVKANQPTLLRLIERLDWKGSPAYTTSDHRHGRHKVRKARIVPVDGVGMERGQLPWPSVTVAIRINRTRTDKSGTSSETAYFITNLPLIGDGSDVRLLAQACRAHWSIENQLRWIRDVVYGEDDSQRYIANLPVIFAACFSVAIAVAKRLGLARAAARSQLRHDRALVGALLGVWLV